MTDSEIVVALECCSRGFRCQICPYREPCNSVLCRDALDLIKRQQAEIERLQSHIQEGVDLAKQLPEALKLSQNAAIKWFAERLVSKAKSTKERFLLESLVESVMKEIYG